MRAETVVSRLVPLSEHNGQTEPALVVPAQTGSRLGEPGPCVRARYSDLLARTGTGASLLCVRR